MRIFKTVLGGFVLLAQSLGFLVPLLKRAIFGVLPVAKIAFLTCGAARRTTMRLIELHGGERLTHVPLSKLTGRNYVPKSKSGHTEVLGAVKTRIVTMQTLLVIFAIK